MPQTDPLDELLKAIRAGGARAVGGDLPGDLDAALPLCQVLALPGSATFEAWGGRTLRREQPFDVYVLARSQVQAGDLAREIVDRIEGVHGPLIVTVDSLPHNVPEYNPRVKRCLFTVTASYSR
ncbi:hypothetical protein BH790_gp14 [Gordonia phage Gsput1]|uniref:Tail terminator n=1 Tax=Gordonia phage Gsput1 TaxID=1622193 RepID=A0A0E3T6Y6_9CAUD|nr:hypothetical protein BH790_gp14 [Gordonia phage Gsput1]AKC03039.1 hypothetical protein Gsput1_14 [Gordonia phage Gsput1]